MSAFPYPLPICPPIAVFWPDSGKEVDDLATLGVKTVAAPMRLLREVDSQFWTPEYPIVVFSSLSSGLISESDRDYIWNTLGVPVFEYLVHEGEILAQECEAHEGLHFEHLPEECSAETTDILCPCGQSGPRLLRLDAIIEETTHVRMWRN